MRKNQLHYSEATAWALVARMREANANGVALQTQKYANG